MRITHPREARAIDTDHVIAVHVEHCVISQPERPHVIWWTLDTGAQAMWPNLTRAEASEYLSWAGWYDAATRLEQVPL